MAEPEYDLDKALQLLRLVHSTMDKTAKAEARYSERYAGLEEYNNAHDRKVRAAVWEEAAQWLDNAIKLMEPKENA